MDEIINKVAQSGIVTVDLSGFLPEDEIVIFDMKPLLYEGLILKEKDFRAFVKDHDWKSYQNKIVGITCTADAIIPTWAYMLVALSLQPYASRVLQGKMSSVVESLLTEKITSLELKDYQGARVVIKGCAEGELPVSAYVLLAARLRPIVKSLMFGEPCS